MRTAVCDKCGKIWKKFHKTKHIIVCDCGKSVIIKNDKVKTPILNKLKKMRGICLWTE